MATYSSLKKAKNLTFGRTKRQCQTVDKIKFLPDGKVVCLGRCEDDFSDDTVYVWKTNSIIPTKIIKERIEPASDMTVTSSGDLMILRKEDPIIRVFQPGADKPEQTARDISIQVDQNVKEGLMFLETTETGYIFIVHGEHDQQLQVFNPEGTAVQTVKLGKACGMAYSKSNKTLYVAADDKIARYQWDGKALAEKSSGPHRVKKFSCTDISIGSDGEVFASGCVEDQAKVYQVEGKAGSELGAPKEIKFDDKEERHSYSPWTCVQGSQFVLVYGEEKPEVGLFTLS